MCRNPPVIEAPDFRFQSPWSHFIHQLQTSQQHETSLSVSVKCDKLQVDRKQVRGEKKEAGIASSRPDAGPRVCGNNPLSTRKDSKSQSVIVGMLIKGLHITSGTLLRLHDTDWTSRGGGGSTVALCVEGEGAFKTSSSCRKVKIRHSGCSTEREGSVQDSRHSREWGHGRVQHLQTPQDCFVF